MVFRYRNKNKVLKKITGLIMAVVGIGILVKYMPLWMWPILTGVGLVTFGWFLFYYAK